MSEWGEGGCVHLLVALCSISKAYKSVVSIAQNVCTNQPCTVCVSLNGVQKVGVGKDYQSHTLDSQSNRKLLIIYDGWNLAMASRIFSVTVWNPIRILVSIKLGYFYIVYHSVYILIGLRKCKKLCTINF